LQQNFYQNPGQAQAFWTELESDPAAKIARGALVANGELIVAVLSFDDSEDRLTLTAAYLSKKN